MSLLLLSILWATMAGESPFIRTTCLPVFSPHGSGCSIYVAQGSGVRGQLLLLHLSIVAVDVAAAACLTN